MIVRKSRKILGIDLGTTNSSVSIYEKGSLPVIPIDGAGNLSMPSVVRFVGRKLDEVKVGSIAKRHIILKPNEVFSSTKSLMKSEDWKDDPFMRDKFNIETEQLSPVDIAAKILEELRDKAHNSSYCDGNFERVVICVPANSGAIYKQHVLEAAELAGFGETNDNGDLIRTDNGRASGIYLLEEPTAAALSYGLKMGFFDPEKKKEQNILVYDFGGGTFDVTILNIVSKVGELPDFNVLSTKGIAQLGGDDLDWALAKIVAQHIEAESGINVLTDPKTVEAKAMLKELAEEKKIDFSLGETEINFSINHMPIGDNDYNGDFIVSKDEFIKAITPLLDKSIACAKEAIKQANITIDDIDRFFLVGGSSKGPWVKDSIVAGLGKEPFQSDNMDTIVSQGAAYYGAALPGEGPEIIRKLSHHYGIEIENGIFAPMLIKGTEIPKETHSLSFKTTFTNSNESGSATITGWITQEAIEITTLENGAHVSSAYVHQQDEEETPLFTWIGEYEMRIPRVPRGTLKIETTMTVFDDNTVVVEAQLENGEAVEINWKY